MFCENLTSFGASVLRNYLTYINDELDKQGEDDILQIVPTEIITANNTFYKYFKHSNEYWAKRQIHFLQKYEDFASDKTAFAGNQNQQRDECLQYWEIPDRHRSNIENQPPAMALRSMVPLDFFYSYSLAASLTNTSAIWNKKEELDGYLSVLLPEKFAPGLLVTNEKVSKGRCIYF